MSYTSNHTIQVIVNQTTGGGQDKAITQLHQLEGDQFGNLNFAGSGLVFHSRTNEPFTVTYTIIGEVVEPTPIPPQ